MRSGTMHIFAISGLHIALIAGILVALVRVLQVPRSACGALVIPLIWFYTAATGLASLSHPRHSHDDIHLSPAGRSGAEQPVEFAVPRPR